MQPTEKKKNGKNIKKDERRWLFFKEKH